MARIRKALIAGLLAAAGALVTSIVQDGTKLSWPVVGAAVGVGVAAALAVWRVPNAPKPPTGVTGRYVPPT